MLTSGIVTSKEVDTSSPTSHKLDSVHTSCLNGRKSLSADEHTTDNAWESSNDLLPKLCGGRASMDIGIGLPSFAPGVNRTIIREWTQRADAGPFSSLGITDRIVYSSFEAVVTLGAMAALTERIRLFTGILVSPIRSTGLLAKQLATVDALSEGRLSMGLAVGGREDDYLAAGENYHRRGRKLEEQIATMRRVWSGERLSEEVGQIGPAPTQKGGPEILIAALSPAAAQRAGRVADGFVASPSNPNRGASLYQVAEEARKEAGRPDKLRLVGGLYFALGEKGAEEGGANLRQYYAFMSARDGVSVDSYIAQTLRTTAEAVRNAIQACNDVGMDEIVLWPAVADMDQYERALAVVG
jgi:alkanesulfonate monooxygenase SsuD/methylene tetrahydromethanopterin reductase-like flavin-dependent oxidoreductase (luciferase family)